MKLQRPKEFKVNLKLKFAIGAVLALSLALFGCATSTLVSALDDVAALADAAAAFVPPPWDVYVLAAADAAGFAATELSSGDPAQVQLAKVLQAINAAIAQTPLVTDASIAIQTAVKGITAALQIVVQIVEKELNPGPATANVRAASATPLKLGRGDRTHITSIHSHVAHVHKLYGK
jgi:hypothetical protein